MGVFLLLQLFACTFYSPYFKMENNCIIKLNKANFTIVSIETTNPVEYYLVCERSFNLGSRKICFDDIPDNYLIIKSGKDTLNSNKIEFKENQIISIENSGGDRAPFEATFIMKNGNLKYIKTKVK